MKFLMDTNILIPLEPASAKDFVLHYHRILFPDAELQADLFPGCISCGNGI